MASEHVEIGSSRTSTRDLAEVERRLASWFERVLPPGSRPRLSQLRRPAKAGMSSETLLLDLAWIEDGAERAGSFVVRLPPPADACPIFPAYDFDLQVEVMRLVGARSRVPVPAVRWQEHDPTVIGAPFFIMTRMDGEVVPDNPPYIFGSWLRDLRPEERAPIERELLSVIAGVHAVQATLPEKQFLQRPTAGATALRRHFAHERQFYEWGRNGLRFPLVESLFEWLENHWPRREGEEVIAWGDARPGNVLWHGNEAAAVLDWEEATIAPRELDLGYAIFFHQYFRSFGLALTGEDAMADFLRRDAAVATYERLAGEQVHYVDWYITYGLLRQSLVEIRISQRRILFGEMPTPACTDEYLYTRPLIERVLSGDTSLWSH